MSDQPTRVLPQLFVLGDSISEHYGPYLEQYTAGKFQYERKRAQDNAVASLDEPTIQSSNGGDSSMVLAYLQMKLAEPGFKPDILLLNCGLHDLRTDPQTGEKQIPLETYRFNLEEIIKLVQGQGIRLVWVRTTPVDDATHNAKSSAFYRYNADVLAYNAAADAIFAAAGCTIIDLNGFVSNLQQDLYMDHVHYHEPIRRLQAAFLTGVVSAL